MKALARLLAHASLLACVLPVGSLAADFDGSKPLICAEAEAHDCFSGDKCERALPVELGLPNFLRLDIAKKTILGPNRKTEAQVVEKSEKQVLLQGTELGYAWTLALNKVDGTIAGSIVNSDGVYALFGFCTPL